MTEEKKRTNEDFRISKLKEAIAIKKELPKTISHGILEINKVQLDVAVLDNGQRIVSQEAVFRAMGRPRRGYKAKNKTTIADTQVLLPPFIDAANLREYVTPDIAEHCKQIEYLSYKGRKSSGYDARILPSVSTVYLTALTDKPRSMNTTQRQTAKQAMILLKGLAGVGIVALIDEATGYEKVRAAGALSKILEEFLHKELRPYSKVFDVEYYIEMYRVHGHDLTVKTAKNGDQYTRTGHFAANFTNDIIYDRLIPGIELRTVLKEKTKGKACQHQGLKENKIPHLKEHIKSVTALLKVSDTPDEFHRFMDRAFPRIIEK